MMPSLYFYPKALFHVFRASRLAKRGRYDNAEWCHDSLGTFRALEGVGIRLEITGAENFRSLDEPCIFVANHMSTLETFVLPSIIVPFREVTYVVKKELVKYPVFRHVMRSRNPVTVGRKNPREDLAAVLNGCEERLKAGISVIIFPQTTRSVVFDPKEFNTIGIKVARRTGAPLIPVGLKTDAWGNGKLIKDFGRIDTSKRVYIAFGEPVRVTGKGDEEHNRVIEFIRQKLHQWENV
jgi:1-acyl-sn-glycerol-3-phosphate acyltransferase